MTLALAAMTGEGGAVVLVTRDDASAGTPLRGDLELVELKKTL